MFFKEGEQMSKVLWINIQSGNLFAFGGCARKSSLKLSVCGGCGKRSSHVSVDEGRCAQVC